MKIENCLPAKALAQAGIEKRPTTASSPTRHSYPLPRFGEISRFLIKKAAAESEAESNPAA